MKLKKTTAMVLALTISLSANSVPTMVSAKNNKSSYQETRGQIDFSEMNISVRSGKKLSVSKKSRSRNSESEIDELFEVINDVPELEEYIVDTITNGSSPIAIGYNCIEVEEDETGNLVPVEEETGKNSLFSTKVSAARGETTRKGNFYIFTSVAKDGSQGDYYYYKTNTFGCWDKHSLTRGESNYATTETDYMLQSLPSSMTITKDDMTTFWVYQSVGLTWKLKDINYSKSKKGKWYWRSDGGNNYIRWDIDAIHNASTVQLYSAELESRSKIKKNNKDTKKINSYYVHTWTKQSISVTPTVTKKETSLSINRSKASKSWQAYCYVVFS